MINDIISPKWVNFQTSLAQILNISIMIVSVEGKLVSAYNTLPLLIEMDSYPALKQAYRDFYLGIPQLVNKDGDAVIIYDPLGLPVAFTRLDTNTFLALQRGFGQDRENTYQTLQERLAFFDIPSFEGERMYKIAGSVTLDDLKEKAAVITDVYRHMLCSSHETNEPGQKMVLLADVDKISKLTVSLLHAGKFDPKQILELVVNSLLILCDGQGAFIFSYYRHAKQLLYRGKDENFAKSLQERWEAFDTSNPACMGWWDGIKQDPEYGLELHMILLAENNDRICLGVVNPQFRVNQPILEAVSRQVKIVTELSLLYKLLQGQIGLLLNSFRHGIILVNQESKIMFVNKAAVNIFKTAGIFLVIGQTLKEQDLCFSMLTAVQEVISRGKSHLRKEDTLLQENSGKKIYLSWDAFPFYWENGDIAGAFLIVEDISSLRLTEEEIIKVNKLESIGIMAGGIAHDFNNFLATMLANISLAKLYGDDKQKIHTKLESTEMAIMRASELSQQLFSFAKGSELVKKGVKLDELIRESINFALSGSDIIPVYSFPDDLLPVEVDVGQFNQVIINLAINALQAMPEGGKIEIKAENIEIKSGKYEHLVPLAEGHYVMFSIKDEGIGIPDKHLSKIFDPFFSTKARGSGLGLFTSFKIIQKHRGHISVISRQGVGTTFNVYLPVLAPTEGLKPKMEAMIVRGRGRILLMDDEVSVRDVAGEMLAYLGYEVDYAVHGREALSLYRKAREAKCPYDVVILDLTIPGGMGGKTAMQELLAFDPGVKAVLASGYANDPVMANYRDYGFMEVLMKPYKMEDLSQVIQRCLK